MSGTANTQSSKGFRLLPCACELNRDIYFHKSPYHLKVISINDYTVFRRAGTVFCARRPAETAGTKNRAHPAMMVHFFMEIA
ncbi:MAG: hypothetical protein AB7S75_15575 [Desulfococcaceae bacterium]